MHSKLSILAVVTILLMLCGVVSAQDIVERESGLYSTTAIQSTLKVDSRQTISIKSVKTLMGSLSFTVADQDYVSLVYHKLARTDTRSKAVDFIDLITVSLRLLPDQVRLELRAPNPAPWDGEGEAGLVEVELILPRNFKVDIDAAYFDVVAQGPLSSLVAAPSLGLFDISGIDGNLELSTKNRRVKLADITGNISVSTTKAVLMITNATSGKETSVFRNEGGDIKIDGFTGEINVKNEFGRIDILKFTPLGDGNFVRSSSGPITVELTPESAGPLVVKNRYEDINLIVPDTISASFILSVDDDGLIEAVNFPFRADLVERDGLTLTSGTGAVEIIGSIRGKGNIYVRGLEGE